ncbi:MAG: hypothetical protein ACREBH_04525 [Candidatus Micrarchaeaceae archaeon]
MAKSGRQNNALKYLLLLIAVIVAIAIIYSIYKAPPTTKMQGSGTNSYTVELTDPLAAPSGTQALVITYSEIMLRSSSYPYSYTNININGSVDLTTLNGTASTIALINNTSNQSFDGAALIVDSANITLDGITYNVTVPSGSISANITGETNATSSGVLISLSPIVMQIYNSSHKESFTMTAYAKAVALSKGYAESSGAAYIDANTSIAPQYGSALNASNLSIYSASATYGNTTAINVYISNNANSPSKITGIMLSGYAMETSANPPSMNQSLNSSSAIVGIFENLALNSTVLGDIDASGNITANDSIYVDDAEQFSTDYHNTLAFVAYPGGTLQLPATQQQEISSGYVIGPHQKAELSFYGTMDIGNGGTVLLIPNQTYSMELLGQGAAASYSLTASAT